MITRDDIKTLIDKVEIVFYIDGIEHAISLKDTNVGTAVIDDIWSLIVEKANE